MNKAKNLTLISSLFLSVALLTGCELSPEKVRDSLTVSKSIISDVESAYGHECTSNPSLTPCLLIFKAKHAQNAAVSSLAVYCQFEPNSPRESVCRADKSQEKALRSALSNLDPLIKDLKGLLR